MMGVLDGDPKYACGTLMRGNSKVAQTQQGDIFIYSRMSLHGLERFSSIESISVGEAWQRIKEIIKYLRERHPDELETDVHIVVSAHGATEDRLKCWFLYEHAPKFNRYSKKATKMFRELVKV